MMKRSILIAGSLAAALVFSAPSFAQRGGGSAGRGPGGGGAPMGTAPTSANSHGNSANAGTGGNSASANGQKTPDQLLAHNTQLSNKLGTLLPKGVTPQQACDGFKNLGQCVAAIHVSHNLGIGFDCLKSDMTGVAPATGSTCPANTGAKKMSLGQSIETLQPNANAKSEADKATKQADSDIKDSKTGG
ncbi:MAG TPA: hypothetical protein VFO34_11135 [Candidatus Acidoferrales bacterium]|nr:hypothetical protein [Candidatus Acidoferrales bacterium]